MSKNNVNNVIFAFVSKNLSIEAMTPLRAWSMQKYAFLWAIYTRNGINILHLPCNYSFGFSEELFEGVILSSKSHESWLMTVEHSWWIICTTLWVIWMVGCTTFCGFIVAVMICAPRKSSMRKSWDHVCFGFWLLGRVLLLNELVYFCFCGWLTMIERLFLRYFCWMLHEKEV